MGTSGVSWNPERSSIVEALKNRKGRLTYVAKDLNVAYTTLKKKIDEDSELTQMVNDLRNDFDHLLVDSAEDVLLYAMAQKGPDLGNALKSTFYILNNKGRSRGYSPNKANDGSSDGIDPREVAQALTECNSEVSGIQSPGGSALENQSPLLD